MQDRHALKALARQGLERRLGRFEAAGRPVGPGPYRERLDRELEAISEAGLDGYFLVAADAVRFARKSGIPVGPGRGASGGSLAAFALEITEIDPLRFGLWFERLLNGNRFSEILVDLCPARRDEVIAYLARRHGEDRVARTTLEWMLDEEAAIRAAGQELEAPEELIERAVALFPCRPEDREAFHELGVLPTRIEDSGVLEPHWRNSPLAALVERAALLQDRSAHARTHPSAIRIGTGGPKRPEPSTLYLPSLKALGAIDRAVNLIAARAGERPEMGELPLDDPAVYAMLGRGDNAGLFELGDEALGPVLARLGPDRFSDLASLYALFRPGPIESGMLEDFIDSRHGRRAPRFAHPAIAPVLEETNGLLVFQEQAMQIARDLAGCSLAEADRLCRAIGKAGIDWLRHGFPKAHAVAYTLIAYRTAWLKARYPEEFKEAFA